MGWKLPNALNINILGSVWGSYWRQSYEWSLYNALMGSSSCLEPPGWLCVCVCVCVCARVCVCSTQATHTHTPCSVFSRFIDYRSGVEWLWQIGCTLSPVDARRLKFRAGLKWRAALIRSVLDQIRRQPACSLEGRLKCLHRLCQSRQIQINPDVPLWNRTVFHLANCRFVILLRSSTLADSRD